MLKKTETFKMETKLHSIIKLLAEALYPQPDVFLRELIQNAHDSIIRRKENEPNLEGKIIIRIDNVNQSIIIQDNGIGMDKTDIKQFLSVIGSSGTGDLRDRGSTISNELIGHFGIGLLSSFVVAEKVYVETRKKGEKKAFLWKNYGSEECELFDISKKEIGSQITVYLKNTRMHLLNDKSLRDIIIAYCDFIKIPIYLNGEGPINVMEAPWNIMYKDTLITENAYFDYIRHRFSDVPLDAFAIDIDGKYKAKGLLYISEYEVSHTAPGGLIDIFIRRMLVKKDDNSLLPSWAKFVRGAIDSHDLKPTTSRDNILMGDPSFDAIKENLASRIVNQLIFIALNKPRLFKSINERHYYHLKDMAQHYDKFFDQVSDLLLFETNRGRIMLKDYCMLNTRLQDGRIPIYVLSDQEFAEYYYHLADAKQLVVINANKIDGMLLRKYADKYNNIVSLQPLNIHGDDSIFTELSNDEHSFFEILINISISVLMQTGAEMKVLIKRFKPINIPALIMETESSKVEEKLQQTLNNSKTSQTLVDVWKDAFEEQPQEKRHFILNADNEIVFALATLTEKQLNTQLYKDVIRSLYHSAWLYANRSTKEIAINMHDSVLSLAKALLSTSYVSENREGEQVMMSNIQKMPGNHGELPRHIRLFLMTPFEGYENVERAVRSVFEAKPFFFEVCLANERTLGKTLKENVIAHIAISHGFIAEISDLNPNVMLEVGAIVMSGDERPMFSLRSKDAADKAVPSDIKSDLYITYSSPTDSEDEIKKAIKESLIKDGRLRHNAIDMLNKKRQAHFLSKTVCVNLDGVALSSDQITALMGRHETIETLLSAEPDIIAKEANIRKSIVEAIQEQLREAIQSGW